MAMGVGFSMWYSRMRRPTSSIQSMTSSSDGRQVADVFAVEWGDERAVQRAEDFVGDLVAGVLDVLQVPSFAIDVDEVVEQVVQQSRAFEDVLGAAIEQVEEAVILGDEAESGKHGFCAATCSLV